MFDLELCCQLSADAHVRYFLAANFTVHTPAWLVAALNEFVVVESPFESSGRGLAPRRSPLRLCLDAHLKRPYSATVLVPPLCSVTKAFPLKANRRRH